MVVVFGTDRRHTAVQEGQAASRVTHFIHAHSAATDDDDYYHLDDDDDDDDGSQESQK